MSLSNIAAQRYPLGLLTLFAAGFWVGTLVEARGLARYGGADVDTLLVQELVLDTVYRTDTVRLWRAKTVYDTARVTDTVVRGDTVFVPRDVADEAINSCTNALFTCEQRALNYQAQADFWRDSAANIPIRPDPVKLGGIVAAGTFLLTLLLVR